MYGLHGEKNRKHTGWFDLLRYYLTWDMGIDLCLAL